MQTSATTAYLMGVWGARRSFTSVTEANMRMSKCSCAAVGTVTALALTLAGCSEQSGLEPRAHPTAPLRTYTFTGRVVNDAGDPVPAQVKYLFEPTPTSIALAQAVAYTDS